MMRKNARWLVLCWLTAALVLTVGGTAWAQKTTIKGLIVGRDGANVIIKSQEGNNVTVTLDDSTKVQAIKGKFGIRRSDLGFTALIPGLPVEVQAQGSGSPFVATTIKFKASDSDRSSSL